MAVPVSFASNSLEKVYLGNTSMIESPPVVLSCTHSGSPCHEDPSTSPGPSFSLFVVTWMNEIIADVNHLFLVFMMLLAGLGSN